MSSPSIHTISPYSSLKIQTQRTETRTFINIPVVPSIKPKDTNTKNWKNDLIEDILEATKYDGKWYKHKELKDTSPLLSGGLARSFLLRYKHKELKGLLSTRTWRQKTTRQPRYKHKELKDDGPNNQDDKRRNGAERKRRDTNTKNWKLVI